MPLIVSSILSKKLAGGAEVLGLDVKCGSGAFMKTLAEARALGSELLAVARLCGLDTHVTVSDMDQPLGRTAGNALEVREAFDLLRGHVSSVRFLELVLHLAAETLVAVRLASDHATGLALARDAVLSGRALERAQRWIAAQGGDPAVACNPDLLPRAPIIQEVAAARSGHVSRVDAEQVGLAVLELGGGRQRATDTIDPAVGVETLVEVGDWVEEGQPMFLVHAAAQDACDAACSRVHQAASVNEEPAAPRPVILEVLA
jgi:thymidine phosphorylase